MSENHPRNTGCDRHHSCCYIRRALVLPWAAAQAAQFALWLAALRTGSPF